MSISFCPGERNAGLASSLAPTSKAIPAAWSEIDPDAMATTPDAVYQAAVRYVEAGLSVIPINAERPTKSPDPRRIRSWKIYQIRLPRLDELESWFGHGGLVGIAVIGGAVSGKEKGCGLEIVDFDSFELAAPWIENVEARSPGLTARLVMVESPRPGLHCYYRCPVFGECQKLASAPMVDDNGSVILDEGGRPQRAGVIEMKAEGGYCLTPPSPRHCHPRHGLYRLLDGSPDLTCVPVITPEERAIIIEEARRLNTWTEPEIKPARVFPQAKKIDGNRPGDDFERRVSWADILEPLGWALVRQLGDVEYWRRPGKTEGISGTVNYADAGFFYPFSTNSYPFEEGRAYSKFHAYTLLHHGGDFSKAARALQEQGYGMKSLPFRKPGDNVTTTILKA